MTAESTSPAAHPALDRRRPYRRAVPGSAAEAVQRVVKLDGRSRIVAARAPGEPWFRLRRPTRLTRQDAVYLRAVHVSEIVVQRGLRRASVPLIWF